MTDMTETVIENCNICGGDRNSFVRASYNTLGVDGILYWNTTMDILECCGCNGLSVRRRYWFSEGLRADGATGEEITYWPPKQSRKPEWHADLTDDNLRQAMQEVYVAFNQGLVVLASNWSEDVVRPILLPPLEGRSRRFC